MFKVGDAVICVDASDLPFCWKPLMCGKVYVIRGIIELPMDDRGAFKGNIHKRAKRGLYLYGVHNMTTEQAALLSNLATSCNYELAYAETRFEYIDADENEQDVYHDVKVDIKSKIAA